MVKPDSSATTGASGDVIATHTIDGKEYQVVMVAGPAGHLLDSLPTYYYWRPFTAGAANQVTFDLFNASGSASVIKVRKLFLHHNLSVITGVGHIFDVDTTTAVGTGGTVITSTKADSTNPAVPAQITARFNATGGATKGATLYSIGQNPEETLPSAGIAPMINWQPEAPTFQDLTLREGEGFRVIQITSNTAGVWGCLVVVTIE